MAVNTTKTTQTPKVSENDLKKEIDKAQESFSGQKLVKVSIPKTLAATLGKTLFVGVNGVFVNIPVDGSDYDVPEVFADHVKQTLNNLN